MKTNRFIKKALATIVTMATVFTVGIGFTHNTALAYNAGIEAFVNSLYADCLGRNADPTGFNDWCNKLATGQITGKQAAYGFFFSPEFIAKANAWTDDQLIEAYYRVFLNRGSDPNGLSYWRGKIAGTTNDVSILFTGFADSTEFAGKCASYGITVGNHVNVPTTTRGSSSGASGGSSGGSTGGGAYGLAAQTNGLRANSVQELDDYWTSQGFEIYYIDLGNGNSQKCYAQFYDMTNHNNMVNAWRNQNGLPSYSIITDPNDPRVQWARLRAVECAYSFAHKSPRSYALGLIGEDRVANYGNSAGENISNGTSSVNSIDVFRNSGLHNAAMLDSTVNAMSTAACRVAFVQPDGVNLYVSPNGNPATPTELPGYNGGLPAGTAMATVQRFWR